jgi:hypothetical protein
MPGKVPMARDVSSSIPERWPGYVLDWSQAWATIVRQSGALASPRDMSSGHKQARALPDSFQRVRMSVPDGYNPRALERSCEIGRGVRQSAPSYSGT